MKKKNKRFIKTLYKNKFVKDVMVKKSETDADSKLNQGKLGSFKLK